MRRQVGSLLQLVLVVAAVASARGAWGVPLEGVPIGASHLNVEGADFVGDGDAVTYLVVDFRAGGGGSFAFGYRHDGMDTAEDMLTAFDAEGVLEVFLEDFSFGPAVRGIGYPREQQAEVFPGAFSGERGWFLWDGTYDGSGVSWTTANVGINGQPFDPNDPIVVLLDGGFYGMTTAPGFPPENEPLVPLPGDFDSDGFVDGDDLLDMILGFGTTAGPTLTRGDADRDGDVDRGDLVLWRENSGAGLPAGPATSSVPEPGSLMLAWLAVLCAASCRWAL